MAARYTRRDYILLQDGIVYKDGKIRIAVRTPNALGPGRPYSDLVFASPAFEMYNWRHESFYRNPLSGNIRPRPKPGRCRPKGTRTPGAPQTCRNNKVRG